MVKTLSGKRKIEFYKGKLLEHGLKIYKETLLLYSRNLKDIKDIKIRPKIDVELSIEEPRVKMAHLEESSLSRRRLRGDQMFVAYFKSKPVAFLFGTASYCGINEISDDLVVGEGEAYLYDAYTLSSFRGNQIFPALIQKAISYYKGLDYLKVIIFTKQRNKSAQKSIEKIGFQYYGIAKLYHFFGLNIRVYGRDSKEIKSHFKKE